MLSLKDVATTTRQDIDAAAEFLYRCDPLFSLAVKLWKENAMMRALLDDREKPPAALIDEELEKIRECPIA